MTRGRMHFRHGAREEPEINLIPFIDVLLVVLIFLMLSTTYNKFTEMQLRLPVADTEALRDHPKEVIAAVSSDGRYSINKTPLPDRSVETVAAALAAAAGDGKGTVVVISADANVPYQSVITVMEGAHRAGLMQITFATQSSAQAGR
jgi:biopolymer transport protein ExbD